MASAIAYGLGIRIIAPDLPGFGQSDTYPDYRLLDWADVIARLADELSIDYFSILGFSAGGPFALACAYALQRRVQQVTLVSSMAPFEFPAMLQHVNKDFKPLYDLTVTDYAAATQQVGMLATNAQDLLSTMEAPLNKVDKQIFNNPDFKSVYLQNMSESVRQGVKGIVDALRAVRSPWQFDPAQIDCPVDIWQGGEDAIIHPEIGNSLHQNIKNSAYHYKSQEGHYLLFSHWKDVLTTCKSRVSS